MAMQSLVNGQHTENAVGDTTRPVVDAKGKRQYDDDGEWITEVVETAEQKIAKWAIGHADALIEALNK
jgi:hypothetical protein